MKNLLLALVSIAIIIVIGLNISFYLFNFVNPWIGILLGLGVIYLVIYLIIKIFKKWKF